MTEAPTNITYADLNEQDVGLMGICCDFNSSYFRGAATAPQLIRDALYSGSSNLSTELGIAVDSPTERGAQMRLLADISHVENEDEFLSIEGRVTSILAKGAKPFILGGDHSVTFPVVKAMAKYYGNLNILHFDAHPDLHDNFEGNPYSHASPFARIMENKLVSRLLQVGIRTLNAHQKAQAKKYSVEIVEMRNFDAKYFAPKFDGPLYISFDIDALDPAYAPGVSHLEPGGLSVREVLTVIQGLDANIVGADIVEFNPVNDVNKMTAMVAAKLVKEIAGKMLS